MLENAPSSPGTDLGAVTGSGLFKKLTHIAPLRHTNVPKIFALVYLHFHSNLSNLHRSIMNFQLLAQSETLNANNVGFCLHLRFGSYLRLAAMTKMKPGPRLGMAEAMAGEVRSTPSIMKTWYIDTLNNIKKQCSVDCCVAFHI
jgi:hypothetical protein